MIDMSVEFAGQTFKNPISTASGTYGFGLEYAPLVDVPALGSITTKGLTLLPRKGNSGVRIQETPAGMLNCIGLENPGVHIFIEEILPKMIDLLGQRDCKIIANISGGCVDDYAKMADALANIPGIAMLEVNISCPNVKAGGMAFGTDCTAASEVCRAVKRYSGQPVIMKLSPNVADIVEIAKALEDAGADALSLINTLLGMSIDVEKQKPMLGNITGGLSGDAIRPIGVRMVWQVSQAVSIPLLGMGGIRNGRDALEYILAGATMVAVGAANFADPRAPFEILQEIEAYCVRKGINSVRDLIGTAHGKDRG